MNEPPASSPRPTLAAPLSFSAPRYLDRADTSSAPGT